MLKSPFLKKSQLRNIRGPGIILFTKIKSPGIRVGDIDHVGIRNEANKNTLKAIANIIANIKKRNQPRMLFRMRLSFDLFTEISTQRRVRGSDSLLRNLRKFMYRFITFITFILILFVRKFSLIFADVFFIYTVR
jgi:hypothetical protein